MPSKFTESTIIKVLDWAYDRAINGVPGLDDAKKLAKKYYVDDNNLLKSADSLIKWQIARAGTSGFLAGLGGVLTMPVALPANISSVLYVQIRMIAAIAYMGGYDLKSNKVRSLVFACLAGNAAKEVLKDAGIIVGRKITKQLVMSVSGATIAAINKRVGFSLLTKFGTKGSVNLGRAMPIVGGIIGGTLDLVATRKIGSIARDTFLSDNTSI